MKRNLIILAAAASLTLAACGGSSSSDPVDVGFPQPAGTVAINFSVDDSVNRVFAAGDLQWKGSMIYDAATRKITEDATWGGPFAPLYDDGPWNVTNATTGQPGHEPAGATAGDNKWGVTIFMNAPAAAPVTISYGLIDHKFGDGWIWKGANGSFVVPVAGTTPITAAGMAFDPFGAIDFRLVLDTAAIDTQGGAVSWDLTTVKVKGSAWAWNEITLVDDGTKGDAVAADGKYTFVLSEWAGAGKTYNHTGLLKSGDEPAFVYVFSGVEYRDAGGLPTAAGASASIKPAAAWVDAAISNQPAGDKNNIIIVP